MSWRPPLPDALVAGAFVLLTVAEGLFSPAVDAPVEHVLVAGAAMVLLAWRRRAPLLVTAAVVVVNVLVNPGNQFSTLLSLVLIAFTVGSETVPPRSWIGLALLVVPFVVVSARNDLEVSDLAAALVFFVGPWVLGGATRARIVRTDEAVERAERAERAVAEERTRIARELHDVVSHSISVVTIQTQAVRRRLGPDHAAEAADLAAVEATAREALAEMRRLFGVLRTDGEVASLAPQPGLGELDHLVRQVGSGDMAVRLTVEGDPVDLSPGVDLAAYRIAQEGLTNALRHAHAREARVLVRYAPTRIDIEVEDDGRGIDRSVDSGTDSGGHGLVGVRERVALYGGTVELGRSSTGGARLAASLPLREAP